MFYFNRTTQETGLYISHVMLAYPSVSIPTTIKEYEEFVFYTVQPEPAFNAETHKLVLQLPAKFGDEWIQKWSIVALNEEELEAALAAKVNAVKKGVTDGVQLMLDTFAQTRGYDGIVSASSYATSKKPQRALEGQYCVDIRDAAWDASYAIMAAVLAGTRPLPTVEEALAEMPVPEWPTL